MLGRPKAKRPRNGSKKTRAIWPVPDACPGAFFIGTSPLHTALIYIKSAPAFGQKPKKAGHRIGESIKKIPPNTNVFEGISPKNFQKIISLNAGEGNRPISAPPRLAATLVRVAPVDNCSKVRSTVRSLFLRLELHA
jgi:hypothetical protein